MPQINAGHPTVHSWLLWPSQTLYFLVTLIKESLGHVESPLQQWHTCHPNMSFMSPVSPWLQNLAVRGQWHHSLLPHFYHISKPMGSPEGWMTWPCMLDMPAQGITEQLDLACGTELHAIRPVCRHTQRPALDLTSWLALCQTFGPEGWKIEHH